MSQLLDAACSQFNQPTKYTTLVMNGKPLVKCSVSTLYSAGIDDHTVLAVVTKQPVSLRCHHVNFGAFMVVPAYHKMEVVNFEPGKPLGEPWWTLRVFVFSFHILCCGWQHVYVGLRQKCIP